MFSAARLREVVLLGPVAIEVDVWLSGSSLSATITCGYTVAAAFHRYSAAA